MRDLSGRLAIHGGAPSGRGLKLTWPPRDYKPGDLLKQYVDDENPLSIPGRDGIIEGCEDQLRGIFKRKHALLCSSGTMALYSAYFALGLCPDSEVICTNVTYHATCSPALHFGAKVILCDVEPDTGNICVEALQKLISPNTRALATNAMWGHPVDQERIRRLCDYHGIRWIEDVSHAHYSEYRSKPVGSFGDIACASLQGPKLISGGEGGVLLTDDFELYEKATLLGHNLTRSKQTVRTTTLLPLERTGYGLKFRIHPLAALIIHDQLVNHASTWVAERKDSLERLSKGLGDLDGIRPPVVREEVTSMGAWYGYKPWVDFTRLGVTRDRLVEALAAEQVPVKIPRSDALHRLALFDPKHCPIGSYEKHDNTLRDFPNSETYLSGLLSLPTPTGQRDEELLDDLLNTFRKVWNHLDELRDEY